MPSPVNELMPLCVELQRIPRSSRSLRTSFVCSGGPTEIRRIELDHLVAHLRDRGHGALEVLASSSRTEKSSSPTGTFFCASAGTSGAAAAVARKDRRESLDVMRRPCYRNAIRNKIPAAKPAGAPSTSVEIGTSARRDGVVPHRRCVPDGATPERSPYTGFMANRFVAAVIGGAAGAVTLTALHQILKRVTPDAPRADNLAKQALRKGLHVAGATPPSGEKLHWASLAGDLAANTAYYSVSLAFGPNVAKWLGPLMGAGAGVGSIALPGPMHLNPGRDRPDRHNQDAGNRPLPCRRRCRHGDVQRPDEAGWG